MNDELFIVKLLLNSSLIKKLLFFILLQNEKNVINSTSVFWRL